MKSVLQDKTKHLREHVRRHKSAYLGGVLGIGVLALAFLGHYSQYDKINFGQFAEDFYSNFTTELISIIITVIFIDGMRTRAAQEREFDSLVLQMGSPDNGFANEAVRILRHRGWLHRLNGKSFWKADLNGAVLNEAHLRKTNLGYAKLKGANLNQAIMDGAKLHDAELEGAMLLGTSLKGVEIYNSTGELAILNGATLYEADLTGAKFLSVDTIDDADEYAAMHYHLHHVSNLRYATMPDGSRYDGRYNLRGDLEDAETDEIDTENSVAMANFYGVTLEEYRHGQKWDNPYGVWLVV